MKISVQKDLSYYYQTSNKKYINPCLPQFYYIKFGFDGVFEPMVRLGHLEIEIFTTLKQKSLNFTITATETKFLEETTLDLTDLLSGRTHGVSEILLQLLCPSQGLLTQL